MFSRRRVDGIASTILYSVKQSAQNDLRMRSELRQRFDLEAHTSGARLGA